MYVLHLLTLQDRKLVWKLWEELAAIGSLFGKSQACTEVLQALTNFQELL